MLGTTTFSTNPTITSFLSTADNSSSIPTTAWVKTYFSTFSSNQILNTIYAGTAYIVTGTAYVSKIQANSSTSTFTFCDNLTSGSFTKILSISSSTPGMAINMDCWFNLTGSGEIGYQSYGGYLRPAELSAINALPLGNASSQGLINPIFSASFNGGTGYIDVYGRNSYSGATTSVIIAMKVASPNPITIS
jgi:hypothetical protein